MVYTTGNKHISFNEGWVKNQSFKDFADHEKHHGLTQAQLKEVYDICKGVEPKKEKPADTAETETK